MVLPDLRAVCKRLNNTNTRQPICIKEGNTCFVTWVLNIMRFIPLAHPFGVSQTLSCRRVHKQYTSTLYWDKTWIRFGENLHMLAGGSVACKDLVKVSDQCEQRGVAERDDQEPH